MIRWSKDRVVVKPIRQTETKSGIIIPEKVETKMQVGEVLGVGPDAKGLKVGDIVYFLKWVGQPIYVDNTDAIYFSAYHIIGTPN